MAAPLVAHTGSTPAEHAMPLEPDRRGEGAAARPVVESWGASTQLDSVGNGVPAGAGVAGALPFASSATQAVASASGALAAEPNGLPAGGGAASWLKDLERDARARLEAGQPDVWDVLTRQFEASLIHTALDLTRGRRIEAAQKLGIGRNTITRKIQELGIDD